MVVEQDVNKAGEKPSGSPREGEGGEKKTGPAAVDAEGRPYIDLHGESSRKLTVAEESIKEKDLELESFREQEMERLAAEGSKTRTSEAVGFQDASGKVDGANAASPKTMEELKEIAQNDPVSAMIHVVRGAMSQIPGIIENTLQSEKVKDSAKGSFPDLSNPKSPLFKGVAEYMAKRPKLYQEPDGLLLAASLVASRLGIAPLGGKKDATVTAGEKSRETIANGTATVEGKENQGRGEGDEDTLDQSGQILANRLGVSPASMASRLKVRLGEGEGGKE